MSDKNMSAAPGIEHDTSEHKTTALIACAATQGGVTHQ